MLARLKRGQLIREDFEGNSPYGRHPPTPCAAVVSLPCAQIRVNPKRGQLGPATGPCEMQQGPSVLFLGYAMQLVHFIVSPSNSCSWLCVGHRRARLPPAADKENDLTRAMERGRCGPRRSSTGFGNVQPAYRLSAAYHLGSSTVDGEVGGLEDGRGQREWGVWRDETDDGHKETS